VSILITVKIFFMVVAIHLFKLHLGAKEQRSKGAKEQRSKGAKEQSTLLQLIEIIDQMFKN
jgi:hypothetical protein